MPSRALTGRTRTWALQLASLLMVAAAAVMAAGSLAAAAASTAMLLAGVVLLTGAELIDSPVMSALASETAPDELRGRYMALFQFSWNVASTVGPALLTALLAAGTTTVWGAIAAVAALGACGVSRLWTAPRRGCSGRRATAGRHLLGR